jgi:hypothetical protein
MWGHVAPEFSMSNVGEHVHEVRAGSHVARVFGSHEGARCDEERCVNVKDHISPAILHNALNKPRLALPVALSCPLPPYYIM